MPFAAIAAIPALVAAARFAFATVTSLPDPRHQ